MRYSTRFEKTKRLVPTHFIGKESDLLHADEDTVLFGDP
jgi:hypothetical protein